MGYDAKESYERLPNLDQLNASHIYLIVEEDYLEILEEYEKLIVSLSGPSQIVLSR
jgi:hypothetical protein